MIVPKKKLFFTFSFVCVGYGFVDFDSPTAAQKAVIALKASGVQAQMAKVDNHRHIIQRSNISSSCTI